MACEGSWRRASDMPQTQGSGGKQKRGFKRLRPHGAGSCPVLMEPFSPGGEERISRPRAGDVRPEDASPISFFNLGFARLSFISCALSTFTQTAKLTALGSIAPRPTCPNQGFCLLASRCWPLDHSPPNGLSHEAHRIAWQSSP